MKSKTIGGRTVEAQIFIPYYDTSYYETPNWDGTIVNRVIVNDIFAKQNVGVPMYSWNGNGFNSGYFQTAQQVNSSISWITGLNIPDSIGLKLIAFCRCIENPMTRKKHCVPDSYGGSICEIRFFSGSVKPGNFCHDNCDFKIKIFAD